jgi:hypothetical protein
MTAVFRLTPYPLSALDALVRFAHDGGEGDQVSGARGWRSHPLAPERTSLPLAFDISGFSRFCRGRVRVRVDPIVHQRIRDPGETE